MATKTKVNSMSADNYDLRFVFDNVQTIVFVYPDVYSKTDIDDIEHIVKHMSTHIELDKSYVDFPENKHQDVFITLKGWNSLCSLVKHTKFGAKSGKLIDDIIASAFKTMITAYLFSVLELYGYDIEYINIDFPYDSKVIAKFYIDDILEWKHYPGPWQDWGIDDNEQQKKI